MKYGGVAWDHMTIALCGCGMESHDHCIKGVARDHMTIALRGVAWDHMTILVQLTS